MTVSLFPLPLYHDQEIESLHDVNSESVLNLEAFVVNDIDLYRKWLAGKSRQGTVGGNLKYLIVISHYNNHNEMHGLFAASTNTWSFHYNSYYL